MQLFQYTLTCHFLLVLPRTYDPHQQKHLDAHLVRIAISDARFAHYSNDSEMRAY